MRWWSLVLLLAKACRDDVAQPAREIRWGGYALYFPQPLWVERWSGPRTRSPARTASLLHWYG